MIVAQKQGIQKTGDLTSGSWNSQAYIKLPRVFSVFKAQNAILKYPDTFAELPVNILFILSSRVYEQACRRIPIRRGVCSRAAFECTYVIPSYESCKLFVIIFISKPSRPLQRRAKKAGTGLPAAGRIYLRAAPQILSTLNHRVLERFQRFQRRKRGPWTVVLVVLSPGPHLSG